jgi:hypothetical protein
MKICTAAAVMIEHEILLFRIPLTYFQLLDAPVGNHRLYLVQRVEV